MATICLWKSHCSLHLDRGIISGHSDEDGQIHAKLIDSEHINNYQWCGFKGPSDATSVPPPLICHCTLFPVIHSLVTTVAEVGRDCLCHSRFVKQPTENRINGPGTRFSLCSFAFCGTSHYCTVVVVLTTNIDSEGHLKLKIAWLIFNNHIVIPFIEDEDESYPCHVTTSSSLPVGFSCNLPPHAAA